MLLQEKKVTFRIPGSVRKKNVIIKLDKYVVILEPK